MFNEAMGDRGKAILGSVTNIPFESDSFESDYSFAFGEIDRAVAGLGGSIIQRHGCVTLTFCLLPSYLLSKLSEGLTRRLLDLSFRLDNRLRNRIRLSLYISYFIEKGEVE